MPAYATATYDIPKPESMTNGSPIINLLEEETCDSTRFHPAEEYHIMALKMMDMAGIEVSWIKPEKRFTEIHSKNKEKERGQ